MPLAKVFVNLAQAHFSGHHTALAVVQITSDNLLIMDHFRSAFSALDNAHTAYFLQTAFDDLQITLAYVYTASVKV